MSQSVCSTSSSGSFGLTTAEYNKIKDENSLNKFYSSWRNDDRALEAYFQACVLNWKMYEGKKLENDVACIFALYTQVTEGDYTGDAPIEDQCKNKYDYLKKKECYRIRGMPKIVAKRRYITRLGEIDPDLLRVKQDDTPPIGFPLSTEVANHVICAKCNTKAGCPRTLTDIHKTILQRQILEVDSLHKDTELVQWYQNALKTQQCYLGVHQSISAEQAKPFMTWFNRYVSST